MTQHQSPQIKDFEDYFKGFLEAGEESLSELSGLDLYSGISSVSGFIEGEIIDFGGLVDVQLETVQIEPETRSRRVVAIDTSSVRVAESGRGVVAAVRGAVVWREGERVEIEVVGPFLFYIDYGEMSRVLSMVLGERVSGVSGYRLYSSIERVLASLVEKRIQEYVIDRFRDSIILFDGSLTAGPLDNPLHLVRRILEKADPRGNDVLAFSKTSVLRVMGEPLLLLGSKYEPPYILDVTKAVKKIEFGVRVLGDVYLARLCKGCGGYRVDAKTKKRIGEVFGSLLKSDPLIYGYPETLILAHDYCTFNKIDLIAIQSLLRKLDANIHYSTSIRDLLFNPLDGETR